MTTPLIVLEYLKVLLSGPVVTGAAALTALFLFRKPIGSFIDRVNNLSFPGGQLSTTQVSLSEIQAQTVTSNPPVDEVSIPVELPPALHLTPEQVDQVSDMLKAERATATLWEYQYLQLFLAPGTQIVLDMLVGAKERFNLHLLDARLQPFVTEAKERLAMMNALQNHHLIQIDGTLITVTEKGREYAAWRGPYTPKRAA